MIVYLNKAFSVRRERRKEAEEQKKKDRAKRRRTLASQVCIRVCKLCNIPMGSRGYWGKPIIRICLYSFGKRTNTNVDDSSRSFERRRDEHFYYVLSRFRSSIQLIMADTYEERTYLNVSV